MLIEVGDVASADVTLLGARALDSAEEDFIADSGIRTELGELPDSVYVALDADVAAPGELDVFMPERGGLTLEQLEALLAGLPRPAGAGLTGLRVSARNERALPRLAHALGLYPGRRRPGLSSTHGRGPDRRPGRAQARSAPVRETASEHLPQVRFALPR